MYVLVQTGSTPSLYVTLDNGFFGWSTNVNEAFQMARQSDAQALQAVIPETTTVVQI